MFKILFAIALLLIIGGIILLSIALTLSLATIGSVLFVVIVVCAVIAVLLDNFIDFILYPGKLIIKKLKGEKNKCQRMQ